MNNKCRICGFSDSFDTYIAKDYFTGSKNKYNYILCPKCNSLSLTNIPDNLEKLYENYYSFMSPKKVEKYRLMLYKYILNYSNLLSNFFCKILKQQDDLPLKSLAKCNINKETHILDVGCGSGALLTMLYDIGYKNCIGIDQFLKKDIQYSSGLKILKKDFFSLSGQFDVIMFHHVFEHFSNPKDALIHINKLLSKNGVCIIRMPDIDSFSFFKYKQNWFSIHAPFHISLPSKIGMKELTKNTGLEINNIFGEQLIEFFFYSMGHELSVSDYEKYGNRTFIEKYGINKIPPLHIKNEIKDAKQRLKQVKKYNLCDWVVYYLKKTKE